VDNVSDERPGLSRRELLKQAGLVGAVAVVPVRVLVGGAVGSCVDSRSIGGAGARDVADLNGS
jgi:hypothetical protein